MELKLLLDGFLTGRDYSGVARAGKARRWRGKMMKAPYDQPEDTMPASLAMSFLISGVIGAAIWSLVLFAIL
jgi:hypothetical protein